MESFKDIDVFQILSLGAVGLGFFFGIFAFRLLSTEQKVKEPRQKIIHSIYIFMGFSIILVVLGIWGRSFEEKRTQMVDSADDDSLRTLFEKTKTELGLDGKVDQFKFGTLSQTQKTDALELELNPNECKLALAMAQPLHKITVIAKDNSGKNDGIRIKKSSGLNFEKIEACAGEYPAVVTLTFRVTKENYKYRAESFFIKSSIIKAPTM